MEELLRKQSEIGKDIDKMFTNFKKDSITRKNLEYLDKRLQILETNLSAFNTNHEALIPFEATNSDHPYFKDNYALKIQQLFKKFKASIVELKTAQATSSAENIEVNFDLDNDKEEKFKEDGSNEQLARLVRRQKSIMNTVTKFLQDILDKPKDSWSLSYCEYKMDMLRKYQIELFNNNQLIWELSTQSEPYEYKADYYIDLENWVQEVMVSLQERIFSLNKPFSTNLAFQQTAPPNNSSYIKLPKISLPTFDGNYLKWTQFRDLYIQLIHRQPISSTQKMFYLISNLTGEARGLIQHLPATAENYEGAWKILCNRYDNKRLLVNTLLNKLLTQPAIQVESASSIKSLHDTTKECLLGLENLGVKIDTWDPILVYLLIKKLDKTTHTLYEQSLTAPRELNSLDGLLKYLESRFQSLETITTKTSAYKEKPVYKGSNQIALLNTNSKTNSCILCDQNHPLYSCKKFLAKSPASRYECLKTHNLCLNCMKRGHVANNCTLRSCTKCSKKHNSLVHFEENPKSTAKTQPKGANSNTSVPIKDEQQRVNQSVTLSIQQPTTKKSYVLLSTVKLRIVDSKGADIECRAILDSGSQLNLITTNLARKLAWKGTAETITIKGISQGAQITNRRVNITIKSNTTGFSANMETHVLPKITDYQPTQLLDTTGWSIPKNITLADPHFNKPQRIDLLIGSEYYYDLLSVGQIKLGENLPTLQNTVFGWIVAGKAGNTLAPDAYVGICEHEDKIESNLNEQVEQFWKLEEVINPKKPVSQFEQQCELYFNETVKQDNTGRFIVRLPFLKEPASLGESKDTALARLRAMERKLKTNPALKQDYVAFMTEYMDLGHMEEIDFHKVQQPYYFLPHHCVLKPDSTTTKLRVVFDASAKTSTNLSLNNILHTGPQLQDELFSILLRFRLPRFVFTADIEKMYRQILIDPDDRKFQLIWWRDSEDQPPKCYQLRTVTYGVTTAPYLAIKCLQRLATQSAEQLPLGARVLKKDFYVDDVMTGSNSLTEALEIQEQLNNIMGSAGFKLRKWCANHPALLKNIKPEDRASQLDIGIDDNCHIKTLGLVWYPKSDEFNITTIQKNEKQRVTKRKVLSDIAHLYDPLGILSPVIVTAKIFFQQLWALKLDWDAAIPMAMHTKWTNFQTGLNILNNIKIPRHVIGGTAIRSKQLHIFCDASENAYGAAAYIRSEHEDGIIRVRLLCAKSKVAPTKKITLPRLELCGAKLAAELMNRIKRDLNWHEKSFLWTDSTIVLGWINSPSRNYQTFVANRIAAIHELTTPIQWKHVRSKENPADLVSRGIQPEKLNQADMWFYGPLFLSGPESAWPPMPTTLDTEMEIKNTKIILTTLEETSLLSQIDHRNSWNHLVRVVAYVVRFTKLTRSNKFKEACQKYLTVEELEEAQIIIIKNIQEQGFPEELKCLKKNNQINASSAIITLNPFIDDKGLIRVGGRLAEANIAYDAKHPILLPYPHDITKLIVEHYHITNSHVGPQALLSIVRQRFWPIKGKTIARNIVQNCVRCARAKPKLCSQIMGNLPSTRVQPARPFINCGVDFCGPFWTHFKIRGKKPVKSYVAIFCCFATKAVHIEVVSDLTTEAFIGALKRFICRRGHCRNIYCDNATNFTGAKNQLTELQNTIYSSKGSEMITTACTTRNIQFHFIPPRAPHFGGLWEAAVKSAKHLFQRSVGAASLTYEELSTVMVEIEAILNSRPLTPLSSNPNDLTALTPGHFLIGESLKSIVDPHATPIKGNLLYRWKVVSQLKNEFWQRWTKEYLSELQHRHKWTKMNDDIQPGLMVILKEDNVPVLTWPLGRIIRTIKGNDGKARVADVKTSSGVLRRPIHRLAPLPISSEQEPAGKEDEISEQREQDACQPEEEAEDEKPEPSRPKRRRIASPSLNMFLIMCLLLPLVVFGQVTVTPFKSQPGLYFESLGTTYLTSNDWNLIAFFDMRTYWQELEFIEYGANKLRQMCEEIRDRQPCDETSTQFQRVIEEINNGNELITPQSRTRAKRAPLDIVGNIANSLFGVLDSNYAEEMSEKINNIENNQQHLLDLLKNQTTIIDSTANIIIKSQEAVQIQMQEFDYYMNQTNAVLYHIEEELQQQKLAEIVNQLAIRLVLTITSFQKMQSAILDVVINAHHGQVNPILLTPKQLKAQLGLIKEHIPPNLRLPVANDHLLEVYKLLTIESKISTNEIIFRIRLPLLTNEIFEIFNVVPIPIPVNTTYVAIESSTEFLMINLHRDLYYPLSKAELSQCTTIGQATHICRPHHPLYRKGAAQGACELSILTHAAQMQNCKLSTVQHVTKWRQLITPNQWMYVLNQETMINVICGTTIKRRTLTGSGILTVTAGCRVTDEVTTIQAYNSYATSFNSSIVPQKNITEMMHPAQLSRLAHPVLSQMNITEDIVKLKNTIHMLQNEEHRNLKHTSTHYLSIGYSGLGLTTIMLLYLAYRMIRKCRSGQKKHVSASPTTAADFVLNQQA